ncbi:pyridoxamine 5'-phosphate oxidase family protein [Pseudonocardia sp. N23]|uniref:pyridoxamine 5'-phosphate oxidase family protein n=1 Tax=Pseudonocardia sp. N23 TaxID=1987376 RepID=UPI000BFBFEDD|nr:pyridoxamine 5'-phosphate oxidase family protein [Pseudonocardia sp. N23]
MLHAGHTGFHEGEIAVQERAGLRAEADRLVGMLAPAVLNAGVQRFLAGQTFVAFSARDADDRLWVTALTGPAGFIEVSGLTTMQVHSVPAADGPLGELAAGQPFGMLSIDLVKRRRLRINGEVTAADAAGLTLEVDQAYGNCPQYIQQRALEPRGPAAGDGATVRRDSVLDAADIDLIRRSDTFFLGTAHPGRGNDASHRGGSRGFVRVEDETHLWWPDYQGNNMFNSFGNLQVDPTAAMVFIDFETGATVHLSGTAELLWTDGEGDDGHTGRRVRFTVEKVVSGSALPVAADGVGAYPMNPPLTDA